MKVYWVPRNPGVVDAGCQRDVNIHEYRDLSVPVLLCLVVPGEFLDGPGYGAPRPLDPLPRLLVLLAGRAQQDLRLQFLLETLGGGERLEGRETRGVDIRRRWEICRGHPAALVPDLFLAPPRHRGRGRPAARALEGGVEGGLGGRHEARHRHRRPEGELEVRAVPGRGDLTYLSEVAEEGLVAVEWRDLLVSPEPDSSL